MKTYSVNEIADMLKTNPETVRRWIRLGKLKATQISRKGGNEVTEQNLNDFLESTPKYAKIVEYTKMAGFVAASSFLFSMFPMNLATALFNIIINNEIRINFSQISISEIEKYLEEYINNSVKKIVQKKEEIKNIQREISKEEDNIAELKEVLKEIRLQNSGSTLEQKGD